MSHTSGPSSTDQELVARILHGDRGAFAALIRGTEGLVARIVCNLVASAEDRRDVVQDTYLKVFNKLSTFNFQSRLSTWIGQIAYNTAVNWLRKKRLLFPGNLEDTDTTDSSLLADAWVMQKDLSYVLHKHLKNLPPMYQLLISLFHQQELSYAEVMVITGLPEGTVKSYLFRARKALKEQLLSTHEKDAL